MLAMPTHSTTQKNILAVCAVEERALAKRTLSARLGDVIATHAGRMWFIVAHLVWFGLWIGLNAEDKGRFGFDPFPFALLTMIVSLESIFLSLFILMSQNRSGLQADRRNHLDLQINLLAEDENTKMIQMLQALCEHHGLQIGKDPEITAMAQRTEVSEVIKDLSKNLPSQE
jgi:uncharacterized membrane protein